MLMVLCLNAANGSETSGEQLGDGMKLAEAIERHLREKRIRDRQVRAKQRGRGKDKSAYIRDVIQTENDA